MGLSITLTGQTCPCCKREGEELFSCNITHNLNRMAEAAGIYYHVWRPDEIGIKKAGQLIEPLEVAIEAMKADPAKFEEFNAKNGWGLYVHFVPWLERYLAACKEFPEAEIYATS